jgi:hypothetical protein
MQQRSITDDPERPTYLTPAFLRHDQTDVDSHTNKVHTPRTRRSVLRGVHLQASDTRARSALNCQHAVTAKLRFPLFLKNTSISSTHFFGNARIQAIKKQERDKNRDTPLIPKVNPGAKNSRRSMHLNIFLSLPDGILSRAGITPNNFFFLTEKEGRLL